MPQLSLKISKNINITQLDFSPLFAAIHQALHDAASVDITTCNSGVLQEDFSYIGFGDGKFTKLYLEVYWLETEQRVAIKKSLAEKLMKLLEDMIVPQIEKQQLICIPRVRIANLGKLDQDYLISKRKPAFAIS